MQVCTLSQTDNHASTHTQFFTGRMLFPPPNQQRQSTKGKKMSDRIMCKKTELLKINSLLPFH